MMTLNGAGKLDLIVGDRATVKRLRSGMTRAFADTQLKEWQVRATELSRKLSEARDENDYQKLRKEMERHQQTRGKIMKEEQTGFVSIYYQK